MSTQGKVWTSMWDLELSTSAQRKELAERARQRRWGLSLLLVGWLHLAAFGLCWFLTIWQDYHHAAGYLAIWIAEILTLGLIFRLCGGPRSTDQTPALQRFVVRVWVSYFLLAFNLGTMNTLRGHAMFELFPAMASLASFAFLMMTFAVHRNFFAAVLVMFSTGLLMAANLVHAYLIFALGWWLILEGVGLQLLLHKPSSRPTRATALTPALAGGSLLSGPEETRLLQPSQATR
jgi:hypothetical protein